MPSSPGVNLIPHHHLQHLDPVLRGTKRKRNNNTDTFPGVRQNAGATAQGDGGKIKRWHCRCERGVTDGVARTTDCTHAEDET